MLTIYIYISRFERELEVLRKELAESAARSSGTSPGSLSRGTSESDLPSILTTESVDIDIIGNMSSSISSPHETGESKKDL